MTHTQVLINLINEKNFQTIAEIGVFKGSNYRKILKNCKNIISFWGVDKFEAINNPNFKMGRITQEQWDQIYFRVAWDMYFFKQFKIVKGKSLDIVKFFRKPFFDFVFIDSNHAFQHTIDEITAWRKTIIPGGYIGGHDYGMGYKKGHRVKETVTSIFKQEEIIVKDSGVWYVKL